VIFLDSCFWHGCRWHCRMPGSNVDYWNGKIDGNKRRDKDVVQHYRKAGWKVIRIWEHNFRNDPGKCVASVQKAVHMVNEPVDAGNDRKKK
jgi:DNA mismatch endonuclease (patch repair protein)